MSLAKIGVWCCFLLITMCVHIRAEQQAESQANGDGQTKPAGHDNKDGENKLKDRYNFVKDSDHIREHLKSQYGFDDKQANEYLKEHDTQTQFFVMHDYDKNTKLDGLELLKSMSHVHEHEEEGGNHDEAHTEPDNTETLIEFVDMILKDQDFNNDGYIDYPEYVNYYSKLGN